MNGKCTKITIYLRIFEVIVYFNMHNLKKVDLKVSQYSIFPVCVFQVLICLCSPKAGRYGLIRKSQSILILIRVVLCFRKLQVTKIFSKD